MSIRVAWFASAFVNRTASGTAQTARKAVEIMVKEHKSLVEVSLLCKNMTEINLLQEDSILKQCNLVMLPEVKGKKFKSARQYYRYSFCEKNNFDILHFSVGRLYPLFWKFPASKFICTLHAAGDVTVPAEKFVMSKHIYNWILRLSWKKLNKVIADSEFALREIEKNLWIPKNKINKIYIGADHLWSKSIQPVELSTLRSNILVIGRWQKYKNVHTIIDAIKKSSSKILYNVNLILVGTSKTSESYLVKETLINFDQSRFTHYEYLADEQLKFLYRTCDLVIHPSINEGFGLPAFEAFGEGANLLVHNGTPADEELSEFVGVNAADLTNLSQIEYNIHAALSVERNQIDLKARREYLEIKQMTWDSMTKNYINLYKDSLSKSTS